MAALVRDMRASPAQRCHLPSRTPSCRCPCRGAWGVQLCSLLRLRFTLARRQWGVTLSQLLIGAAAICLLSLFQVLANAVLSTSTPHMPSTPLGTIPRCVAAPGVVRPTMGGGGSGGNGGGGGEPGCWTILYYPVNPATRALMANATAASGLVEGVDYAPLPGALPWVNDTNLFAADSWVNVTLFTAQGDAATCAATAGLCSPTAPGFNISSWLSGECAPCSFALDNRTASELTGAFPGSVQSVVWFVTQGLGVPGDDMSFSVAWNLSSTMQPFLGSAHAAEVKLALDAALLARAAAAAGIPPPALSISLKDFPRPPPRISGFDIFAQSGAQWCFLPAGLLFFQLLTGIVVEKEEKLRIGMRQMGLRASAYWAAWALYALTFASVSTLILVTAGHAAGFTFFSNSAFFAPLLLFWSTSLSYAAFAVFLSSLVTTAKSAQQLGYSLALISFMFIAIVGSGSGILLDLLYSSLLKPWMRSIRNALLLLSPALAYTFVLYDIVQRAGSTLDVSAQRIVTGPGFAFSDLGRSETLTIFGYTCDVPSPIFHVGVIFGDLLIYTFVGLWLDAILPGPQGSPSHPLFFLGFKYTTRGMTRAEPPVGEDVGVAAERKFAADAGAGGGAGPSLAVRIDGLRVVYRKGLSAGFHALTGIEWGALWGAFVGGSDTPSPDALGAGDVIAVKDVSLTVQRGEIVALLGHNGAGKSTTVHVLTGLVSAAGGVAEVAGADVIAGARSSDALAMGVCPQHDLLFPLLTAREMLHLFCGLKGIPEDKWEAEIASVLTSVNLADVADRATATFSGGMKRRLSVALASLGSPPLLLFDEPSTGLDPLARADLLLLLQSLKRTSGLLLTTHSMAEAASLGDRIAIMAGGSLVACGTTVELTQRYGSGYVLSLTLVNSEPPVFESVAAAVARLAPAAKLTLRDGAAVSFTVPFSAIDTQLSALLEWCDEQSVGPANNSGVGGVIKEFGVSGPTLEDAFLAVTAASHFGLAEQALGHDSSSNGGGGGGGGGDGGEEGRLLSTAEYMALAAGEEAEDDISTSTPRRHSLARLLYALFIKNLTLLSRARGLCLCQLLTPLLILGLLLTLEWLLKTEVGLTFVVFVPPIYIPLNNPFSSTPHHWPPPDGAAFMRRAVGTFAHASVTGRALSDYPSTPLHTSGAIHLSDDVADDDDVGEAAPLSSSTCFQFYLIAADPSPGVNPAALAETIGAFPRDLAVGHPTGPPDEHARGFLRHVSSSWCSLKNSSFTPAPFFDSRIYNASSSMPIPSSGAVGNALDDELMRDLLILNKADVNVVQHSPPCDGDPAVLCPAFILPDGVWIIHELKPPTPSRMSQRALTHAPVTMSEHAAAGGVISATLQVNTAASSYYHRPNGVSRPQPPAPGVTTLDAARLGAIDRITRAYSAWTSASSQLPILSFAATMGERRVQTLSDIVEIISGVLFVILLSAPLPLFVFVVVTEKELRLNEMQLSMGVKSLPAQGVTFTINATLYAAIVILFWGVAGGYMQLRVMAHSSPLLLALTFLGHGLALVSTGTLVSAFLSDRQVATVLGVILGIISPLIATSIMAGVYGRTLPWSLGTVPPPSLYAIPILGVQFALARILYLATFSALAYRLPLTAASLNPAHDEVGVAIISLFLSALSNTILAHYLEQVLPRRYGTPQHPLYCCPSRVIAAASCTSQRRKGGAIESGPKAGAAFASLSLQQGVVAGGLDEGAEAPPFAHTHRWAPSAGLSEGAATAAYALGEDADVFEARRVVSEDLWPLTAVDRASVGRRFPVVLKNLRKEWPLPASARSQKKEEEEVGGGVEFAVDGEGGGVETRLLGARGEDGGVALLTSGGSGPLELGGSGGLVPGLTRPYVEAEQRAMLRAGVKVAVSDLTLAIPAGACFGLLGENGAGKSSTVAVLQGLHAPTAGTALVGGFDVRTEQQAVRLGLGICPQHDVLWPSLTIGEHLYFYARVKGVSAARERGAVRAMLARVGLTDFEHRAADALSGGMRRRLSIAIAMIGNPAVVLLDELTTGLDPASRRAVWRVVDTARRAQPSAVSLVISHDMAEVEALCSSPGSGVAIMTHGRVRALGTVQHLRNLYGNGCLLRVAFRGERVMRAGDAAGLLVGAILGGEGDETAAWVAARERIEALFPRGAGSARVEGHVFQTRAVRCGVGADAGMAKVVEAGSTTFCLSVGSRASGAEVSIGRAFKALREGAAGGGVVSWAVEAQTLEAVFARVVRHYHA